MDLEVEWASRETKGLYGNRRDVWGGLLEGWALLMKVYEKRSGIVGCLWPKILDLWNWAKGARNILKRSCKQHNYTFGQSDTNLLELRIQVKVASEKSCDTRKCHIVYCKWKRSEWVTEAIYLPFAGNGQVSILTVLTCKWNYEYM